MDRALPLIVLLIAAVVTYATDLWLLDWLKKRKITSAIRAQGPETHQAKAATPALGGAAFPLGFLIALAVAVPLGVVTRTVDLTHPGELTALALLLLLTMGAFLIGFADDYSKVQQKSSVGLKARYKFPLQLILGAILAAVAVRSMGEAGAVAPTLIFIWFTLFFSGTINAVNFTDGLDGLLAGTGVVALVVSAGLSYGWFAAGVTPVPLLGHAAMAGAGCLVGFYPLNRHAARLFMGDGGAYFIGALLATIAVLQSTSFLFVIIGGVFYLELASVMLQVTVFKLSKGKKRLFPMTPLHHSFEVKGWPEEKVVGLFWFAGLVCGLAGIFVGRLE